MQRPAKLHLGPTFDPVRYEELEKEAKRKYKVGNRVRQGAQKQPTRRGPMRFRIRLRIPPAVKRMASKISRLGSRRREQNRGTIELSSAGLGEEPFNSAESMKTITAEEVEVLSKEETLVGIIGIDDVLSSDDTAEEQYAADDSLRRYQHQLPCEEAQPEVEEGLVNRLASLLEMRSTGDLSSSKPYEDTASSVLASAVHTAKSKNINTLGKAISIPSPPPLAGPSLRLKASSLTSDERTEEDCQTHG